MSDVLTLARGVVMAGVNGANAETIEPYFGGYILFPEDGAAVPDVRALTDVLRSRAGDRAPIIAIDQEGGAVMRIRRGLEPIPSMMALGAAGDVELARRAGEQIGFDLRRAGATLDCAPVLDLALEAENAVIGTRSFGADPLKVAALGAALAEGLRASGILPCFKHFPGHGSTAVDSHAALPVIDADAATLRARDLLPFAAVAPEALAVMSAHVVVRAFDPNRPATLVAPILGGVLRGELGFEGAVLTDCLEMNAVAAQGSVNGAIAALAAGADLLIFSHDEELANAVPRAIAGAVDAGTLSLVRLRDAYSRVERLRALGSQPLPIDTYPPHEGLGREIARRAVTLVRGLPHAEAIASIAISFGGNGTPLHHEAPALEELVASLDPATDETDALLDAVARHGRRPLLLTRRAHRHPAQARAIATLIDRYPDALVVSLLEPFDLPLFDRVRHLMATCGDSAISSAGLADVIFGGSPPLGHLPVSFQAGACHPEPGACHPEPVEG